MWLGAQGKAEQQLGRVEQRLGGAGEAAELCGAAELLGVPLTITCCLLEARMDINNASYNGTTPGDTGH